jgi:hypothetical protein
MDDAGDGTRPRGGPFADELHGPGPSEAARPTNTAPRILDFSDRPARVKPRASALEWIALVLAVVLPPLGLLVSIVARIVTRHRHHWVTSVARWSTAVSIVLTIALGGGAVAYSVIAGSDAAEAAVLAEARPLCDGIAATPGVLEARAFGWPVEVTPIPATLDAMRAYQAQWSALADLAPASAEANVRAIADQAQILIGSVEASQAIDRQANLSTMTSVTDASGLTTWVRTYCD